MLAGETVEFTVPIRRAEDAAKVIDAMGGRSYLRVLVERQGQAFVTEFVIR